MITFRRYTADGYTANVYVIVGTADPADDPQVSVSPGDLVVRFVGGEVQLEVRTDSGTWAVINDWDGILSKPTEFYPEVHDLDGDRHAGKLPITKVSGHTLRNPVHVQTLAAALLRRSRRLRIGSLETS